MLTTILTSKDIKTQLAITRLVAEYTANKLSELSIQNLRSRVKAYAETYPEVNFINLVNIPLMNIFFPIFKQKYGQAILDLDTSVLEEEILIFRKLYSGIFADAPNMVSVNLFLDLARAVHLKTNGDFNNDLVLTEIESSLQTLLNHGNKFDHIPNLKLNIYLFVMNTITSSRLVTLSQRFVDLLLEVADEVDRLQAKSDVFHLSEIHMAFLDL